MERTAMTAAAKASGSTRRRGRPRLGTPYGAWRDSGALLKKIQRIVGRRDARRDDPEAITDAGEALVRLAARLLKRHPTPTHRLLTLAQKMRLRDLARTGRASEIERQLLQWRFGLAYRDVRRLKAAHLAVFIWHGRGNDEP
jgi:hypothetical protein